MPLSAALLANSSLFGTASCWRRNCDCPNDRYVNDEAICQAVVAILARIGVKADLLAQTKAKYFGKINAPQLDTSFYFIVGLDPGTLDALDMLSNLTATRKEGFRLHQQIVVWAGRDNVDLAQLGNNDFQLRYVKLK